MGSAGEWSCQCGGRVKLMGLGMHCLCVGKKTLATPDTQAVCSQHRNEGFGDFATTTKHFKG